jgi:hypothetical protein
MRKNRKQNAEFEKAGLAQNKELAFYAMLIPDPNFFQPRIPDPNFFHPGSRIRIIEFTYFNQKNCFQVLGNMIPVVHPGSGSWLFTHPGSRGQKSTVSRIPHPNS